MKYPLHVFDFDLIPLAVLSMYVNRTNFINVSKSNLVFCEALFFSVFLIKQFRDVSPTKSFHSYSGGNAIKPLHFGKFLLG